MFPPKLFPLTLMSCKLMLAQGSKFDENVIFLTRDKLRVKMGLRKECTQAMVHALLQASRLTVLNAADVGFGILMC